MRLVIEFAHNASSWSSFQIAESAIEATQTSLHCPHKTIFFLSVASMARLNFSSSQAFIVVRSITFCSGKTAAIYSIVLDAQTFVRINAEKHLRLVIYQRNDRIIRR